MDGITGVLRDESLWKSQDTNHLVMVMTQSKTNLVREDHQAQLLMIKSTNYWNNTNNLKENLNPSRGSSHLVPKDVYLFEKRCRVFFFFY